MDCSDRYEILESKKAAQMVRGKALRRKYLGEVIGIMIIRVYYVAICTALGLE